MFINFSSHELISSNSNDTKEVLFNRNKDLDKKSSVTLTLKDLRNSESGGRGGDRWSEWRKPGPGTPESSRRLWHRPGREPRMQMGEGSPHLAQLSSQFKHTLSVMPRTHTGTRAAFLLPHSCIRTNYEEHSDLREACKGGGMGNICNTVNDKKEKKKILQCKKDWVRTMAAEETGRFPRTEKELKPSISSCRSTQAGSAQVGCDQHLVRHGGRVPAQGAGLPRACLLVSS